jgi:hypothetical protein
MPLAWTRCDQYNEVDFHIRHMTQSSKKQVPQKKRSSPTEKEGLVPLRFTIDETLYAFLAHLAKRSGKSVSEIASMYIAAGVDKDAKINPSVDRALQQIVAEDIAKQCGPLLRLLNPMKASRKVVN